MESRSNRYGQVWNAPVATNRLWATTTPGCTINYSIQYAIPGKIFYWQAPYDAASKSFLIETGVVSMISVSMQNAIRGAVSPQGCLMSIHAETPYDLPEANDPRWAKLGSSSVTWSGQGNGEVDKMPVGHALKGIQIRIPNSCGPKTDIVEMRLKTPAGVVILDPTKFVDGVAVTGAYVVSAPLLPLSGNLYQTVENVTLHLKNGVASCEVDVYGLILDRDLAVDSSVAE